MAMSQPILQQTVRKRILSLLFVLIFLVAAPVLRAQIAPHTQVHDATILKPPPGARVAIVEFDDMECPECAFVNPILMGAVAKYHIPWIRYDFPLPFHAWSFQAAVDARWFDTKSKELGDDFRNAVFANQRSIETPAELRIFAENFAQKHGIGFPFVIDPQGKLAAAVKADYALGQRIGIEHTPTIWVVTNQTKGVPYVEVVDPNQLYSIIDQALAETANETPPHTNAHRHKASR
jgi:protein-disulfide isomerase